MTTCGQRGKGVAGRAPTLTEARFSGRSAALRKGKPLRRERPLAVYGFADELMLGLLMLLTGVLFACAGIFWGMVAWAAPFLIASAMCKLIQVHTRRGRHVLALYRSYLECTVDDSGVEMLRIPYANIRNAVVSGAGPVLCVVSDQMERRVVVKLMLMADGEREDARVALADMLVGLGVPCRNGRRGLPVNGVAKVGVLVNGVVALVGLFGLGTNNSVGGWSSVMPFVWLLGFLTSLAGVYLLRRGHLAGGLIGAVGGLLLAPVGVVCLVGCLLSWENALKLSQEPLLVFPDPQRASRGSSCPLPYSSDPGGDAAEDDAEDDEEDGQEAADDGDADDAAEAGGLSFFDLLSFDASSCDGSSCDASGGD